MASLFITVWRDAEEVALGQPLQEMAVTISGTAAESAVLTGKNRARNRVRLMPDTNCFVTWNTDPTALNDGFEGRAMGSEAAEYFDIEAGHKISVIERT